LQLIASVLNIYLLYFNTMADSIGKPLYTVGLIVTNLRIDRVFAHALQTVRKIPRSGSLRPPAADRLKLYGLYKQSMEGDVEGVMERPGGYGQDTELSREEKAEQEKWFV
jgi:acyl-CoA-binding protein